MKTYSFVKRPGVFSFNTQESIVFRALQAVGTGTIEELADKAVELGLKTRQAPERIVQYYLVSLRKLGLVESEGTTNRKVTVVIADDEDEGDDAEFEEAMGDDETDEQDESQEPGTPGEVTDLTEVIKAKLEAETK